MKKFTLLETYADLRAELASIREVVEHTQGSLYESVASWVHRAVVAEERLSDIQEAAAVRHALADDKSCLAVLLAVIEEDPVDV